MSGPAPEPRTARGLASAAWGASLVVAAAVAGSLVLFDNKGFLHEAIQSDSLLPALAVWDYSTHDYALGGFQLASAPSLVPDLLVYATVQLASGSWRLASFVYGCLSLLGFAAIAGAIVRDITGASWRTGAQCALLLALGVIVLELPVNPASNHLVLFLPAHHGGSFILSLAMLSVARRWLERPAAGMLALLLGLVVAGVLSDLLFVITGVGALLAVLAHRAVRRRIAARQLGWVLACLTIGLGAARLLDRMLIREPIIRIDWASVPGHARAFLTDLANVAAAEPLTVLLVNALPLLAMIGYPLMAMRRDRQQAERGAAEFWWVASASSVLVTILAIPLRYVDPAGIRYASALLWWPLIWAAALLVRWARPARGTAFAAGLSGTTIMLGVAYFWAGAHAPALLSLHHPLEACLLEGQRSGGLGAGLAGYWQARAIEASSDWRLQVDQISKDGSVYYWGNDRFWYTHDIHDGARAPRYNYIVMADLDESAIRRNYGPPSRTLDCGGTAVWVYDDAEKVRRALVSLSPILSAVR